MERFSSASGSALNKSWLQSISQQLETYKNYKMTALDQLKIVNKKLAEIKGETLECNLAKIDLVNKKKIILEQLPNKQLN